SDQDIDLLSQTGCAVIWCPSSNDFLFGKTARVSELKKVIRVALGSDSTLTGMPTLLDEMRSASDSGHASAREIFEMVSSHSADIFHLLSGKIMKGSPADLVLAPMLHPDYHQNILQLHPKHLSAVFVDGECRFGDPQFSDFFKWKHMIYLNGSSKSTD